MGKAGISLDTRQTVEPIDKDIRNRAYTKVLGKQTVLQIQNTFFFNFKYLKITIRSKYCAKKWITAKLKVLYINCASLMIL